MKARPWFLLAVSMAFNVVTVFVWFRAAPDASSPAAAPGIAATARTAPLETSFWAHLQTDSMPQLVERLRAAHCPPHLLAAIVATQLQDVYEERKRALSLASTPAFWKNDALDANKRLALIQLDREQRDELRRLLGQPAESFNPLSRLLYQYSSGIPEAKVSAAQRIIDDYRELRAEVAATNVGYISSADESGAKVAAIEKAMRDELAGILTPEEWERYNLVSSRTARELRFRMMAFAFSEEEFRLIFQKKFALDEQLGHNPLTPEEQARRSAAHRTLNEEIKALLGPERGAEYERASDFHYTLASLLADRLQLPPTTAPEAWNLQKAFTARAQALSKDAQLSAEQRSAEQAALLQEATSQLTSLFGGAQGFELYKRYGGQWLRALAAPPPAPRN